MKFKGNFLKNKEADVDFDFKEAILKDSSLRNFRKELEKDGKLKPEEEEEIKNLEEKRVEFLKDELGVENEKDNAILNGLKNSLIVFLTASVLFLAAGGISLTYGYLSGEIIWNGESIKDYELELECNSLMAEKRRGDFKRIESSIFNEIKNYEKLKLEGKSTENSFIIGLKEAEKSGW